MNKLTKKDVVLLIMFMSGCIDYDSELLIYESKNSLRKFRDRCRYQRSGQKKETTILIESYVKDKLRTDRLTPDGKAYIYQKYPETYKDYTSNDIVFQQGYHKETRRRQRMAQVARTMVNMYINQIPCLVEDKIKISVRSPDAVQGACAFVLNKEIMEQENYTAFYGMKECKQILRLEVRGSRATGVLVTVWKDKEVIKKENYVVYNMCSTNIRIQKSVEQKINSQIYGLTHPQNEYSGGGGMAGEIIYADRYDMVPVLLRNSSGASKEEQEVQQRILEKTKKKWIKEHPGEKYAEEFTNSNFMIHTKTFFVLNGLPGNLDTKLLAYPRIKNELYKSVLRACGYENAAHSSLEDGYLMSKEGFHEIERTVYIMFPLNLAKLSVVDKNNKRSDVIILRSQEQIIRIALHIEEKEDISSDGCRIRFLVYNDDQIRKFVNEGIGRLLELEAAE